MKHKETIVEAETSQGIIEVMRVQTTEGITYEVWNDGVLRHPECTAEAAMRALGFYLHGTRKG